MRLCDEPALMSSGTSPLRPTFADAKAIVSREGRRRPDVVRSDERLGTSQIVPGFILTPIIIFRPKRIMGESEPTFGLPTGPAKVSAKRDTHEGQDRW